MTDFRILLQLAEAFGPINRWFCSQAYCREMDDDNAEDRESLLKYYIKSGGAADFARRYSQAIGTLNRWYCSEFYRRDVRDPEVLWEYYVTYAPVGTASKERRSDRHDNEAMSVAC